GELVVVLHLAKDHAEEAFRAGGRRLIDELLAEHAKQAGMALRGDREVRAEAAAVDLVGHLPDPVGAAEALAHPADLDVVAGGETGYPDTRPVPLVQAFQQVG